MQRKKAAYGWAAILLLFLSLPLARSWGLSPTVVIGLYGSGFWLDRESPSPDPGVERELGIAASALAGWRTALAWGGTLGLSGSAAVSYVPPGSEGVYDRETLELLLHAPVGGLRLEIETALGASGLGTQEGLLPYLRPSWSIAGRWLGERGPVRPFVEAPGYLLLELSPDETAGEDVIYQGGVLGLALVPSFQSSYRITAEAGWQRWLEQVLFDAAAVPTTVPREDLLTRLRAGGEWLLGYFATARLSAEGGVRWSNANRLTGDPVIVEANSESRWFTRVDAGLSWSPRRELGLEAGGFLHGEWYIDRELPAPLSGDLSVLSGGMNLRLDWTPDDRWYLVLDASVLGSCSQDPLEQGWNLRLQAGVELSL